jgi:hypothetical protein
VGLAGVVRWVWRGSVVAGAVVVAVAGWADVPRLPRAPIPPPANHPTPDLSIQTDPGARAAAYADFVAWYLPYRSFESDPEIDVPPPARWRKMWEPDGPGMVTWDTQVGRSGRASMCIQNTYFGADRHTSAGIRGPLLPVIPGPDVVKFSAWVRTENATGLTLLGDECSLTAPIHKVFATTKVTLQLVDDTHRDSHPASGNCQQVRPTSPGTGHTDSLSVSTSVSNSDEVEVWYHTEAELESNRSGPSFSVPLYGELTQTSPDPEVEFADQ